MILIRNNVERITESEHDAEKLIKQGYKPLGGTPKKSTAKKEAKSIRDMNTAELRSLAKEKGIKTAGSLSKVDLLNALKDVEK